jgi:hypothetical protein
MLVLLAMLLLKHHTTFIHRVSVEGLAAGVVIVTREIGVSSALVVVVLGSEHATPHVRTSIHRESAVR